MCDDDEEGRDPLEFIPWRNSKFKDHKQVDEMTKRALLYTWIEIRKGEELLNEEVSRDDEWEEHEFRNHPNNSFPKPYLNIKNEENKNHYDENNGDAGKSTGMDLSGTPRSENINNKQPNEGICRVDKFEVIKYTIGGAMVNVTDELASNLGFGISPLTTVYEVGVVMMQNEPEEGSFMASKDKPLSPMLRLNAESDTSSLVNLNVAA
ncbi:hypothetical protein Tco_0885598 [Tanacetum coccineum]